MVLSTHIKLTHREREVLSDIPSNQVTVSENDLQKVTLHSFPQAVGRRGAGEQLLKGRLSQPNQQH